MKLNSETQKKIASEWFKYLQLEMCKEFESLEKKLQKEKELSLQFLKKKSGIKKILEMEVGNIIS